MTSRNNTCDSVTWFLYICSRHIASNRRLSVTSVGCNFTDRRLWMTSDATDRSLLAAISPKDVCGTQPMPLTDVCWWQFHRRTSVDDVWCHRQTSVGCNFTDARPSVAIALCKQTFYHRQMSVNDKTRTSEDQESSWWCHRRTSVSPTD